MRLFPVFQVSRDQLCLFSLTLGWMKCFSGRVCDRQINTCDFYPIKHFLAAQTCRWTLRHLAHCIEKEVRFGSFLSGANMLPWSMSHSALVLIQGMEAKLYLLSPVNKKKNPALLFLSSLVAPLCPTVSGRSNDAAAAPTGPTDAEEPFKMVSRLYLQQPQQQPGGGRALCARAQSTLSCSAFPCSEGQIKHICFLCAESRCRFLLLLCLKNDYKPWFFFSSSS